jgi:hypothetical protein
MNTTNNALHFAKVTTVSSKDAGLPEDSGNGYYSYTYYKLPYSGKIDDAAMSRIYGILHKRHYCSPFTSFGGVHKVEPDHIVYSVTYHHGD